jgi:hypothetical protein
MRRIAEVGRIGDITGDILSTADPPFGIIENLTPLVSMLSGIEYAYH